MAQLDFAKGLHMMPGESKFGTFAVFHFESTKSSELGLPFSEAELLRAACSLLGHRFSGFRPLGRDELTHQLEFIFSTWEVTPKTRADVAIQFALHFSCHGNEDGIQLGRDFLRWNEVTDVLKQARGSRNIAHLISISACGGVTNTIGRELAATKGKGKPLYIFSFDSKVPWSDAALAWAILYQKVRTVKGGDRDTMIGIIDAVRALDMPLMYRRWDGAKYRRHPSSK